MGELQGRRVVLTGVSRGIGFETAKRLLDEGAQIVGVARDAGRLEAALKELGGGGALSGVAADMGDASAADTVAQAVRKRWDALDILINNAGVQTWVESYEAEPPGLMQRDLEINVLGPHRLAKALLPLLLKGEQPRIINVSSGAGLRQVVEESADMPAYRLSKYALNALTILQSNSLKGKVSVNSLDPGWLKTDLGGPKAPGEPADGARRILELLAQPFEKTGKFWHGKELLPF